MLVLLTTGLLTSCRPAPAAAVVVHSPVPALAGTEPPLPAPTVTPTLIASPLPATLPPVTPTPAGVQIELCSPLPDVSLTDLPAAVSNPYHLPRPGSDDPHHGVDFADLSGPGGMAISGQTVQAALPGTVVTVIQDRFPYGNALIVETPLDGLPVDWLDKLDLPRPVSPIQPISLTCPSVEDLPLGAGPERSLYLLYAHMQSSPVLSPGDSVACGETLGAIGDSGNALNPHLHLEVRVGDAGARLDSLAHYDASAGAGEMAAYCAWRVQGYFQPIDPLLLFR